MQSILTSPPAWVTALALFAAVASAAATGALFQPGAWYRTLRKPGWTPPDWLFPIAWTMLYLAMGLAAWLVTVSGSPLAFVALALWCWQLVLNAVWSPVFFGLRRIPAAFAVIIVFWIALAATTWVFLQIGTAPGLLMLPYLLWVSYAAALNLALWILNPADARRPAET